MLLAPRTIPRVTLGRHDIRLAHEWGDACAARVVGPNHTATTGTTRDERFSKGYLGELGFFRLCEVHGIRCDYRVETTGRSAAAEFTVYRAGHPRFLDVKTAGGKNCERFRSAVDSGLVLGGLYVGARLECVGAWFMYRDALDVTTWGWLDSDAVAALPQTTLGPWTCLSWDCRLDQLRALPPLLAALDAGPQQRLGRAVEILPARP